jgi:hypothetical protein
MTMSSQPGLKKPTSLKQSVSRSSERTDKVGIEEIDEN